MLILGCKGLNCITAGLLIAFSTKRELNYLKSKRAALPHISLTILSALPNSRVLIVCSHCYKPHKSTFQESFPQNYPVLIRPIFRLKKWAVKVTYLSFSHTHERGVMCIRKSLAVATFSRRKFIVYSCNILHCIINPIHINIFVCLNMYCIVNSIDISINKRQTNERKQSVKRRHSNDKHHFTKCARESHESRKLLQPSVI